jgi:hypothetical protein
MTTLTLRDLGFIGGLGGYDTDAQAYITAVETADGQSLEVATKDAINAFVVGCKADGIWSAIKASCILAGARTLAGALVPLVGTAPTNFNFVSGDYNRKTGLGDASNATKYLNTNRAGNADPQNSRHAAVYASSAISNNGAVLNAGGIGTGATSIEWFSGTLGARSSSSAASGVATTTPTGIVGTSRTVSTVHTVRYSGVNATLGLTSSTPSASNYRIFTWSEGPVTTYSSARLAFYSIGESLDLALLDARVSALITAIGAAF